MERPYKLGNMFISDVTQSYPDTFAQVPIEEKDLIVIHHTATPGTLSLDALYAAHKKYGGIGYNALVYPTGRIIMTGQWNTSRAGAAQIPRLNWRGYHCALVGDFTIAEPSIDALSAMKWLLRELQYARGMPLPIVPHCMFNAAEGDHGAMWNTTCPGATWLGWWGRLL